MHKSFWLRAALACCLATVLLLGQQRPPVFTPVTPGVPPPVPPPPPAQQEKPAEAPKPQAPATTPQTSPPATPALSDTGGFLLDNVSLVQFIDILARRLKINYILDPAVKGAVTIHTYGEVKQTDLMTLLETVLRINGAATVKVGDLYRIVPIKVVSQLPLKPQINGKQFPEDERMVLNLIFLKYASVADMSKLIQPFLGESATLAVYEPANLMMIQDNSRSMNRTMELIALFDNDTFASQRVRLFEVTHGRPSDLVKELENVFKAFALSDKSGGVKFMPVDRINTIIAVAPNPGIFVEVEKWLKKLDVPMKITAGSIDNYVYRLRYGRAESVAMAIMALYGGINPAMMSMMGMGGMGFGGMGMGGMGTGFGGMGFGGGMGFPGMGMGGMGMGGMGMGGMGMGGMGMGGMGGMGMPTGFGAYPTMSYAPTMPPAPPATGAAVAGATTAAPTDLTGSYLGGAYGQMAMHPRIIPNPFDNTLLVQGTPQEWEQIAKLLEQLDVPPRQVLIEAKIYEVDLSGQFASGVRAFLQRRDSAAVQGTRQLQATSDAGLALTAGLLVGGSRELLTFLSAQEQNTRAKVIAAPSVVATDSIPASINVGQEVPTLSSQAVAPGVQQGGSSLFTNTIQNRNTGVTLNILARVNSSGIVTMMISQEVSAPQAPAASSAIQSPSFSKRNVQTQITVQDGDTVAIGGIIQESDTFSTAGIPGLHRIPVLGGLFGNRNYTKTRTELIVFLTPRVIYDTNQIAEASDEVRSGLKKLKKMIKE